MRVVLPDPLRPTSPIIRMWRLASKGNGEEEPDLPAEAPSYRRRRPVSSSIRRPFRFREDVDGAAARQAAFW